MSKPKFLIHTLNIKPLGNFKATNGILPKKILLTVSKQVDRKYKALLSFLKYPRLQVLR